jgi:hypothetical protein
MSECYPDQLARVRLMAQDDAAWDLSDKDLAALQAVLADYDALRAALTEERDGIRAIDWLAAELAHADANFKAFVGEEGDWNALATAHTTSARMVERLRALLAPAEGGRVDE